MLQQRAYELFKEALAYVNTLEQGKLRAKFECKMLEGYGHLLCEPLLFDLGESYLEEAEEIYNSHKGEYFTELDLLKFQIKKSAFLKKYGFFEESLQILLKMEKQLMEILRQTTTN